MKKFFKDKENITIVVLSIILVTIIGVGKVVADTISADRIAMSSTNMTTLEEKLNTLANTVKYNEQNSVCPAGAACLWKKSWSNVAIGDYVRMTPNPGTLDSSDRYPTDTSKTGYSSVQYIYPKQLNLWRVIKKNSDGTVEMVSEYVSSTNVYFKGTIGYANFVEYLNTLADQYKNPTYTQSTRHMGYYPSNPQTSTISDTSYFDGTSTKAKTEWTSSTTSTLKQKSSNESLGGGDTLYAYDTEAVTNALGTLLAKRCADNTCSTQGSETSYWLASRYYYYSSPNNFAFRGRCVKFSGSIDDYNLRYYSSNLRDNYTNYALRPIVTLKSGLNPSYALGTKERPFVLG